MFQAGAQLFQIVGLGFDQPQPPQHAQAGVVQWDGVAAQALLRDPGYREIVGGVIARQVLGRLLHALLVQSFQIKRKGRLEHFLQEFDDALGASLRLGQAVHGVGQLAGGTDANLVPVEELLLQITEGLIGLLAANVLAANGVQELFQHGPEFQFAPGRLGRAG